jgi:phosphoribosylformylglycinamidine cyclo-ligase
MLQIFNCGIGYMLVVPPEIGEDVVQRLRGQHEYAQIIGTIERLKKPGQERVVVEMTGEGGSEPGP